MINIFEVYLRYRKAYVPSVPPLRIGEQIQRKYSNRPCFSLFLRGGEISFGNYRLVITGAYYETFAGTIYLNFQCSGTRVLVSAIKAREISTRRPAARNTPRVLSRGRSFSRGVVFEHSPALFLGPGWTGPRVALTTLIKKTFRRAAVSS